ncbi:MAG: hypothetical protein EU536_03090 [Promethearchaeota archaeon]|nr:MAG: hypothetical protein EU536_03090 [Candidatus Lokiarchaeota archaeon]
MEILLRSTCFISIAIEQMQDRITNFPFPEYNLVGITYFFELSHKTVQQGEMASITLLIDEKLSVFVNRNIENLKENLRVLSRDLNKNPSSHPQILSKYNRSLVEMVNSYKSVQIIASPLSPTEQANIDCVLLSYFHSKIGPIPFICYPDILEDPQKNQISRELEFDVSTGFFTRSYPDFISLHHYFELPSDFARGKVEMCLISFVFQKFPTKDQITDITFQCTQYLNKLLEKPQISLAFYRKGYQLLPDQNELITEMFNFLTQWIRDLYEKVSKTT